MNAREYQAVSARTLNKVTVEVGTQQLEVMNYLFGLVGEWGEFLVCLPADEVDECGDCWWYFAALHSVLKLDMSATLELGVRAGRALQDGRHVLAQMCEMVKKWVFHGKAWDMWAFEGLLVEFGAALLHQTPFGVTVDDVWAWNKRKLEKRYKDGFVTGGGVR